MKLRHGLAGCLISIVLITASCAEAADLGSIDFPNSGAPEAQESFTRAVLLLHSFEYEDAREAFQEAQRADPNFALAYWGEAMTHNHPLWRQRDRDAAVEALAKLAATAEARREKAPTQRERDYLHAVEVLYDEGEKIERDFAYCEVMGDLVERYPDDLEARAFYALSILGTAQPVSGGAEPRAALGAVRHRAGSERGTRSLSRHRRRERRRSSGCRARGQKRHPEAGRETTGKEG